MSLDRSFLEKTFFSFLWVWGQPGVNSEKTKVLQEKTEIHFDCKRWDSSLDSLGYCVKPVEPNYDRQDDINLDILDEKKKYRELFNLHHLCTLKTLVENCGLNVLDAKCGHTQIMPGIKQLVIFPISVIIYIYIVINKFPTILF